MGGKVLVAGGMGGPTAGTVLKSAELSNPSAQVWTPLQSMKHTRAGAVACTLPSGRVAVLGGHGEDGVYRQDGELYNPATGRWAYSRWGMYSGDYIVGAVAVSHGMVMTTMKGYSVLYDEESRHCVRLPKSTFTGESRDSLVHVSVPTSALTNEVASDRRGDQSSSNVAL